MRFLPPVGWIYNYYKPPQGNKRRQVAAALLAAVTTTKLIGERAHLAWARPPKRAVKSSPSHSSGGGPGEGKTAIAASGG